MLPVTKSWNQSSYDSVLCSVMVRSPIMKHSSERMTYGTLNILDIFLQVLILASGAEEPSTYLKLGDQRAERQC